MQAEIFLGAELREDPDKEAPFRFNAYLSSAVKDVHGVRIKDSLMNIGLGILDQDEWGEVKRLIVDREFRTDISTLSLPAFTNINGFENDPEEGNRLITDTLSEARKLILEALDTVAHQIDLVEQDPRKPSSRLAIVPVKEVGFLEQNKGLIGPRQDTLVDPRKAQIPETGKRLHAAETRKEGIENLFKLGLQSRSLDKKALERFQREQQEQIRKGEAQFRELEEELIRIAKVPADLQEEHRRNEISIPQLEITYTSELRAFKAKYKEEHDSAEPKVSHVNAFDKKNATKKELVKKIKRQDTITQMLKKMETEIPIRTRNIKEQIQSLMQELKGYGRVLKEN